MFIIQKDQKQKLMNSFASQLYLQWLVAFSSDGTPVCGRRTFPALRSTCSWRVTTYVGKPTAASQPTGPTQPFILLWSINE